MSGTERDPGGGVEGSKHRSVSTDERGVSEVYGTVLIISMAFVTAMLVVGLGAFVIQDTSDEFTDAETRDAMFEFDDALAGISGETANASDEVSFPEDSAESLSTAPGEGRVRITVSSTAGADVVEETGSSTFEVELGTVTHEAADGSVMAYQGGALWKVEDDRVRPASDPPLDFDGTAVDFSFISFADVDSIPDGQPMTASRDEAASAELREEFLDAVAGHWRVEGEDGATAPVDVTIEIESAYASGWAAYMQNDATEPLADHQVDVAEDRVTFELTDVGSEFEFATAPEEFPEDVTYAGLGEYAQYNEGTTGVDGGPAFEIASSDNLAVYDAPEGEWVRHTNPWETVDGDEGRAETALPASHLGGDRYEVEPGAAVCIVEGDQFEDCDEALFGVANDDLGNVEQHRGEFELEITDVANDDSPDEPVDAGEDTLRVDVRVRNTGAVSSSQEVVLTDADGRILARTAVDDLAPGDEEAVSFAWSPPYTATSVEELAVGSTGPGTSANTPVDIRSPDPHFEVAIDDVDGTAEGQTMTVEATVTNEGLAGSGEVWLETPEGHLENGYVPDATTVEGLPAGESEPLELEWPLLRGDAGETEVEVRTPDDAASEPVEITRGVLYAGPADAEEAPFLHEHVTPDQLGPSESAAGGYPLDDAVEPSYDLYRWNEVTSGWERQDPAGVQDYEDAVETEIENTVADREDLSGPILEYTHYELDENAPVCVVDKESDIDVDESCGDVNLDAHITLTPHETLDIGAEELDATLLTAQIGNRVDQRSTQVRDPIDVVHTVGQSGALIDDEYKTHWPHSGPIGDSEFHFESSVSELESQSLTDIPWDTGLGVRGVYEDEGCSWSPWFWEDECPVDNGDLAGGSGYHLPTGTLFDFDFDQLTTYAYDEDDGTWKHAEEVLDDDDVYHVDMRFQPDAKLYDVPADTPVRVHHDNLFADWWLIGNWIDGRYDLIAQDPDKYRYLAVTEHLALLDHADDRAGLVTFNDAATNWMSLRPTDELAKLLWWQDDDLASRLHDDVHEDDDLHVWTGLTEAEDELDANGNDGHEEFIVLVANAVHDPEKQPHGGEFTSAKDTMAIEKARQLGAADRPVYTVGLGPHADEWLLRTIAEESGGEYRSVLTADELPAVFEEIATRMVEQGDDAIERDHTTLTARIDGEETTLDFGLIGGTNVNDPAAYNQSGSEARTLTLDGFTSEVNEFALEMAVSPCSEARDSGVTATVEGEPYPYSECTAAEAGTDYRVSPGDASYRIYRDGDKPSSLQAADWQQSVDSLATVEPYWDDEEGAFDLDANEAILAMDARTHPDYDGYVLVHLETADRLTSQHFEWDRPVVESRFEPTIEETSHTVDAESGLLSAEEGETIEVTVNVTNAGEPGRETVALVDDTDSNLEPDTVLAAESLHLDAGETRHLTVEWETERGDGLVAGAGRLREDRRTLQARTAREIDGNRTEIVHPVASLQIDDVDRGSDDPHEAFDTSTVAVDVTNAGTGEVDGDGWVWLEHRGDVVAVGETADLDSGEETTVPLTWTVGPDQIAPDGETDLTVRTAADSASTALRTTTEPPGIDRAVATVDETPPVGMSVDRVRLER